MNDLDQHLLQRYSREGDQAAFAELLRRHLNLVHGTALRQVRSPQLAEEVAQTVFAHLARHARFLPSRTILPAWLWQVANRTAINVVRHDARRRQREQTASELSAMNEAQTDWTRIEPFLDEALRSLSATDCALVLLRWFEDKSVREIAATLSLGEAAAQRRGIRALDRLRTHFARRGVTTTAGALAAALAAHASPAAPAGLAATLTENALLSAAAAPAGWFAGLLAAFYTMSKTTKVILTTTALVVVVFLATVKSRSAPASDNPPAPKKSAVTAATKAYNIVAALDRLEATRKLGGSAPMNAVDLSDAKTATEMIKNITSPVSDNAPLLTDKMISGTINIYTNGNLPADWLPFEYMVQYDSGDGLSHSMSQQTMDVPIEDSDMPFGKGMMSGLSLKFDKSTLASTTVNDDGSTTTIYTRPDGATKMSFKFNNGVDATIITRGNYQPTPAAKTYQDSQGVVYTVKSGALTVSDCQHIKGAVTIPSSYEGLPVTSIGSEAFELCKSLTGITIPASVTSIGEYAFIGCTALTSVTIPHGVISLGQGVFQDCTELTSVSLPDSVTIIDKTEFADCPGLTTISVQPGNPNYSSVNGVLFNGDQTQLLVYPHGQVASSYTIPSTVTSINDLAFADCTGLTSVTIPASVTSIGFSVFRSGSLTAITVQAGNPNLSSINGVLFSADQTQLIAYPHGNSAATYIIPSSVTSVGDFAFYGCSQLTSVTLPANVTSIGLSAFHSCVGLTSVTFPASLGRIGDYAYFSCTGLTSIYFAGNAPQIGDAIFHDDPKLTLINHAPGATGWGATFSRIPP